MTQPSVTVVMPTHRRPDSLLHVLQALNRQDVPAGTFEVVVVCDGLQDPSMTVLRDDELFGFPLRVVEQANQGPAAARNRGIGLARGGLIVFLDDDVVPSQGLIRAHLNAHGEARDLVVGGPLLPPRGHGSPWIRFEGRTLADQYRAMETGKFAMTCRQFFTGNASVRRERLLSAGGFDETFRRAEDVELGYRLADRGASFHFAGAADVEHMADRSYPSWLEVGYRYGRADARMGRDHNRHSVLESAGEEFHYRHPLTRRLVMIAFAIPPAGRAIEVAAQPLSVLLSWLGLPAAADRLLALVFNLTYWRGMADELGGRDQARNVILSQPEAETSRTR